MFWMVMSWNEQLTNNTYSYTIILYWCSSTGVFRGALPDDEAVDIYLHVYQLFSILAKHVNV